MFSATPRWLGLALATFAVLASAPAFSQGVTTAAMNGAVVDAAGNGLPGATVVAVHEPSGTQYGVSTRSDGQFNLRNLRVGGPYTVTASFVGYETDVRTGLNLQLSQDLQVQFTLAEAAVALGEAVITAESNSIISSSNIGTGTNVTTEEIERLPTINRSLVDFTRLTPQFSQRGAGSEAGTSVGGTSSRYNNVQVDGAALNDAFGLENSGTPGGSSGTQPISLDAVEEFRVAIAPYDVSQGGFTGGNINVVTRSGTNSFEGSVYGLGRNQDFVGDDLAGNEFGEFEEYTAGARLGGPIIQDKLFFFANVEGVRRTDPVFATFADGAASSNQFNATQAEVQEIVDILNTQYGRGLGELGTFEGETQSNKFFGRLDYNLNTSTTLTGRFNYVQGRLDDGVFRSRTSYNLDDRLYTRQNTNTSTVVEAKSLFGQNAANLARISFQTNRQPSVLEFAPFPSIEIRGLGDDGRSRVQAGPDQFRGANNINTNVLEVTNDFNYFVGDHVLTFGTQNTFSSFENLFIRNFYGYYRFNSLDDFRDGEAAVFERNYSAIPGEDRPLAEFAYANFSLYGQDEWRPIPELKLTGGLRFDLANYFDSPTRSAGVESAFGLDNSEVPNGNVVVSPRFGFNYDVGGRKETQLRGGLGVFNGSNPAVWISNSFSNDGTLLNGVSIGSRDFGGPIPFRADADNQYVAEDFGLSQGSSEINLTDPDFVSPTVFRTNLAVDQQLPAGFVATAEGLYSNVINGVQWQSLNRQPFTPDPTTVDGRTGERRNAVSRDFQDVILLTNTDQGYSYNLTGQLRKQAGAGILPDLSASLAYTYSQAKDINSATSSQARSNVRDLEVGLDVNDPPLTTSDFELAHRVLGQVSYRLQYGGRFGTTFSLLYEGQSGNPYSFIYFRGDDVNGDGFDRADLVYVPASRDEVEISDEDWAALDAFIEATPSLREQRGQIFERNSARAPWNDFLDARITQQITTLQGQKVELTLDVENLFSLLGSSLGEVRFVDFQRYNLIDFQGYTDDGRQIISFDAPEEGDIAEISNFQSRWRMQLGLRYTF